MSKSRWGVTIIAALLLPLVFSGGCERKEKLLDIETPSGEMEVERSKETGDIDVEATDR